MQPNDLIRTGIYINTQDALLAQMRNAISEAEKAQWDLEELEDAKRWYDKGMSDTSAYSEHELPRLITAARLRLKVALVSYATMGEDLCSGMLSFSKSTPQISPSPLETV